MKHGLSLLLLVAVVTAVPTIVHAQDAGPSVRGYAALGTTAFTAADTFEAVAGTTRRMNVGGGVSATLWKGLFADMSLSQVQLDGERIFIDEASVYPLGIPLQVTMRPFDVAGGWRMRGGRLSPYVGAGISRVSYKETSSFAGQGDDVSGSGVGALVLAGADVALTRWLHLGAEVRYRNVENVLGTAGASAAFGDRSLGGLATSFRASVGR